MRRSGGFTLLEVMLAITILGIVATAVYGTFSRTLRSKSLAEDHAEVVRTGRAALARMADEIGSAFYPDPKVEGAIFRSLSLGTETTPLDALVFSALSVRPAGAEGRDSDQRVIAYFFPVRRDGMRTDARRQEGEPGRQTATRDDDESEDFFAAFGPAHPPAPGTTPERLLRRESLLSDRDAIDRAVPMAFLDDVASLELRFFDGAHWLEAWDSEDRENYRPLPRAVAIDLALYDAAGTIHHFATAVDLALADPRPPLRSDLGASPVPGRSPGGARLPGFTRNQP